MLYNVDIPLIGDCKILQELLNTLQVGLMICNALFDICCYATDLEP